MRRTLATFGTWILAGALSIPAQAPAPAGTHPYTVDDQVAMDRLTDPQPSPDGSRIAFVISSLDLAKNRRRTDLWLVGTDGGNLRRLTSHEGNDSNPRWTADGRFLFFLSTRSGSSQVHRIAVEGGEAEQVTREPLDVAALLLSPDGSRMAYAMDVFPDCDTPQC